MGAYVFIGVGAVTMLMGFLGCIGAVNEVRCLLGLVSTDPSAADAHFLSSSRVQPEHVAGRNAGWRASPEACGLGAPGRGPTADFVPALCPQYFAFLLLILIAQVTAGALFYFNMGKVSPSLPSPSLGWTSHVGG